MRGARRFSQAISEGSGISLVAEVASAEDARTAEESGADALFVYSGLEAELPAIRQATDLPIVFFFDGERRGPMKLADACVLDAAGDVDRLRHVRFELGDDFELVVRVVDEDQLRLVLDELDPEIFLLASRGRDEDERLEHVLGLLPDVPAGKLAVAEVADATRAEVLELERAGVDAAVVGVSVVAELAGETAADV